MFSQIADLLIRTAFGFFVYALLLRFYMQWLRAPFRNPVGQFVTALTDWAVRPVRRLIPGLFGVDGIHDRRDGAPAGFALSADRRDHRPGDHQLGQSLRAARAGLRCAHPPFLRCLPALRPADRQRGPLAAVRAAPCTDHFDPPRERRTPDPGAALSVWAISPE